ncbi:11395_t:CDS:2 [Gigaspora margarita]|uniref:11395_t:CDS:1 n=1 Tax=Gigaspora margarita TaxID=4874 RepID=A0ABN7U8G2_GIGMA|nr:11395_t:CDS:2 [Gigaspora margarita]
MVNKLKRLTRQREITSGLNKSLTKKCKRCDKRRLPKNIKNINSQYCNFCNQIRLSGNEVIDKWLIKVNKSINIAFLGCFEFIPFEQFNNIIFLEEGGFSKIYKAICINGIKREWNSRKQIFLFDKSRDVILKSIKNSEIIDFNFLNELENYLKCMKGHYPFPYYKISNYLGITQDPNTQNFMIVVEFAENGDLNHFISKNIYTLSWYEKLRILQDIAYGIEKVHNKQIIHQDLHSGNLLVYSNTQRNYVKVADFGISKPLNTEGVLKKILSKELEIPEVIKMPSVEYKNSKSIYTSRPLSIMISEALRKYQTKKYGQKSMVIDFNL